MIYSKSSKLVTRAIQHALHMRTPKPRINCVFNAISAHFSGALLLLPWLSIMPLCIPNHNFRSDCNRFTPTAHWLYEQSCEWYWFGDGVKKKSVDFCSKQIVPEIDRILVCDFTFFCFTLFLFRSFCFVSFRFALLFFHFFFTVEFLFHQISKFLWIWITQRCANNKYCISCGCANVSINFHLRFFLSLLTGLACGTIAFAYIRIWIRRVIDHLQIRIHAVNISNSIENYID